MAEWPKTLRCWACAGKGTRSSWINKLGREVEGRCPDCNGTGRLPTSSDAEAPQPSDDRCTCRPEYEVGDDPACPFHAAPTNPDANPPH
jgi:hypothetical protein